MNICRRDNRSLARPTGRRILPRPAALAALVAANLLVGCSGLDSPHITTLAKLQNIKSVMRFYCDNVMTGSSGGLQSSDDLAEFMYRHGGTRRPEDPTGGKSPVVDGWGTKLRLEGTAAAYNVRSAGPDRVFDTEDDIYLTGGYDWERLVDGVKEQGRSALKLVRGPEGAPFQEPSGIYSLSLPGSYSVTRQDCRRGSEYAFSYSPWTRVVVRAEDQGPAIDLQRARTDRVWELRSGLDPEFTDFEVIRSDSTCLDGAPGFEVALARVGRSAALFEILTPDRLKVEITVTTGGKEHQQALEVLTDAVRRNLHLP